MTDTDRIDKALTELPAIWAGLTTLARRPTRLPGPAGSSPSGPRPPMSIAILDQAEELHAALAAWAMHVGARIGATPPLRHVRFTAGIPVGGLDPRGLCQWLASALPEVPDTQTLHDMAADICPLVAKGRSTLGLTEVSPETRHRALAHVDAMMLGGDTPGGDT